MIRPAQPADLLLCLRIAQEAFHGEDRPTAKWFLGLLAMPSTVVLVADTGIGGGIDGFCVFRQPRGCSHTIARLLAVGPWARRQGVGRALLGAVGGPMTAWVREENAASRGLCLSLGFAPVRLKHGWIKYGRGVVARPEEN